MKRLFFLFFGSVIATHLSAQEKLKSYGMQTFFFDDEGYVYECSRIYSEINVFSVFEDIIIIKSIDNGCADTFYLQKNSIEFVETNEGKQRRYNCYDNYGESCHIFLPINEKKKELFTIEIYYKNFGLNYQSLN